MIPLEPATLLLVEYPGSGVYTILPVDTDYGMSLLVVEAGGTTPSVLRLDYAGELDVAHTYTSGAGYVDFTAAVKTGSGTMLFGQQPVTPDDWNTFVRVGHDGAVLSQNTLEKTTGFPVARIGNAAVLGTDVYLPFVEATGGGGASASDYGVIKLNAAGEIVWQKSRFFSASENTSTAMVVGGNIVAVFERVNVLEIYTLSPAGALLSAYTIANNAGCASAATDGTNIYLDGYLDPGFSSRVVTKHAAGVNLWSKRVDVALFNGYGYDLSSLAFHDGYVYQSMFVWNATSGGGTGTSEVVLVKIAADGTLAQSWGFRYAATIELIEANVAVNADGVTLTILTDADPESLAFVFTFGHDADCYGDYGDDWVVYQPSVTLTDVSLTVASSALVFTDGTRALLDEGAVTLSGTGPDVSEVPISSDPGYANGFRSTRFGAPVGSIGTFADATGFSTTAFGSHISRYVPEGFSTTSLGVPFAVFDQFLPATGFAPVVISTPAYAQVGVASSIEPGTIIPGAFTAQDQMVFSEGRATTRFGTPLYRVNPDITVNAVAAARGFMPIMFGTPQSPYEQAGAAEGIRSTVFSYPTAYLARPLVQFGAPRLVMGQQAAGLPLLTFGTPELVRQATTLGQTLRLGSPDASVSRNASGFAPAKFGRPAVFTGGHKARALALGRRFGTPRAHQGTAATASGLATTQYGTHQAAVRNRAMHLPPIMRFGVHTLTRNPEC